MGGLRRFKLDAYLENLPSRTEYNQSLFKQIWDFFKQVEAGGSITEIARNNGTGGGTGYHDETPFATNAWFVFMFKKSSLRTFPYYVMFQMAQTSPFGSAPGSPAKINGTTGATSSIMIAFSVASAFDSSGNPANPWGGTTGSPGSDTKGTPVWVAPVGGSVHVYPRSNNFGGSFDSTKEDMCGYVVGTTPSNTRLSFVADNDNFFINYTSNNDFLDTFCFGVGYIVTVPEIQIRCPLFQWAGSSSTYFNSTIYYGTQTGLSPFGGSGADNIQGTSSLNFGIQAQTEKTYPNTQASFPGIFTGLYNLTVQTNGKFMGWADPNFWRTSGGFIPKDTNSTKNWMVYGSSVDYGPSKIIVPWDGISVRGNNLTRSGIVI